MPSIYGNDLVLNDGDIVGANGGDLFTASDYDNKNPETTRFDGYHNVLFSLADRLLTNRGDNVFHPRYGSELYTVVSTPNSSSLLSNIKSIVSSCVLEDERVKRVVNVTVESVRNQISVKIELELTGATGVAEFVFPNFVIE